jgi:hypothetical protein
MVQVNRYFDEEEPAFRRYNGRGHGYPLSHDRELTSGPNHGPYGGHYQHHQQSAHDGRAGGQSPEQDSNNSNPRRRIPVAVSLTGNPASMPQIFWFSRISLTYIQCGRCRKRKIRCSGDPGNGGPCTNCKAAGNDTCQFLRVNSSLDSIHCSYAN